MTDTQLATLIRDNAELITFSNDAFIRRAGVGWRITRAGERDAWVKTIDEAMEKIMGSKDK